MIENPETGSLEAFNFEHLEEHVPELKNLGYKISSIQFDPPMDSSEMGPDSWMKIVHVIAEHYHDYDGFVVLHGTDTMAFTAYLLAMLPMLIIYCMGQKYIVKGLTAGSVKG